MAYRQFMAASVPIVRTVMPAIRGEASLRDLPGRLSNVARSLRREPLATVRDLRGSYDTLLRRRLPSDLTRGPVAAFAAHAAVGPTLAGGALFAFWQAAYHLFGQWHPRGGAQALTDALLVRLAQLGGRIRCSASVERIEAPADKVTAIVLQGGEAIATRSVLTAIDPQTALLRLLQPPLAGRHGADLAAARRGNVVQSLIHVATDRLPPYPGAREGDWNGLQSYVDRLEDLSSAWAGAEAGRLPDPLPLYAFTTSALDDTLAPPGHHTVYLACPAAPAKVDGGWGACSDRFVETALETVESRAPGFRASIQGVSTWAPEEMEDVERWPGGHPMHLDIALDQLGPLRRTRRLGRHRTPIEGLYISGAGTAPAGGILGTPGRQAAEALLEDR